MGTLPPQELLNQWRREELTVEMAIGHLLQNLIKLQTMLETLNLTLQTLRADVDSLLASGGKKPSATGRKQPPKKKG